jgi:hypothetical protein
MFGVESIFQGKSVRNRHSWLTCITSSRERAQKQITHLSARTAEQRLFEFDASEFPVYFVGASLNYQFVAPEQLIARLSSEPLGEPDAMLFNVYRFYREYLWSVPGEPEYCSHYHISSEALAEFRAGRGELYAVLHGQEV